MEGEYNIPRRYSQIINTWNISMSETSSAQLLTTSKIHRSKCKLRKVLIGVGIIVIFVTIALTSAILLSSKSKNLIAMFIKKENLTTENIASYSMIDTKHPSSRNSSFYNIYHGSSSNATVKDLKNQITTSIPTLNESTIENKGKHRF